MTNRKPPLIPISYRIQPEIVEMIEEYADAETENFYGKINKTQALQELIQRGYQQWKGGQRQHDRK